MMRGNCDHICLAIVIRARFNQLTYVKITRNSAVADKPRDAFRGQSRSPNMVPFHMLHMVSYYCAIVRRTFFFRNSTSKNVVTFKTGLR